MQQRNPRFFFFMLAAMGFMLLWTAFHQWLYPPIPPEENPEEKAPVVAGPDKPVPTPTGLVTTFARDVHRRTLEIARLERQRERERNDRATPSDALLALGSTDKSSKFHLGVQLDPRGAGVRSVLLNKFANQNADGRPVPGEFELVPAEDNDRVPANVLYHFDDLLSDRPVDTLGRVVWKASPVSEEKLEDGRTRQTLTFTTEVSGVEIVKRFTLVEREYHVGLEVVLTRKQTLEGKGANRFRYQLSGARGLPIEGKWYTSIFRTSLIAQEQNGSIFRDYQDVRQIGIYGGGQDIIRDPNRAFRYAAVAVQYFASAVVMDPAEGQAPYIARVRPTLERSVTRGTIKSIAADRASFVLHSAGTDYVFQVHDWTLRASLANIPTEVRASVVSHTDRFGLHIAEELVSEFHRQPLWVDDITVRLTSETLDLKQDEPVTHRFLLYNGPVKPSLLSWMKDETDKPAEVPAGVVSRYVDGLKLNTLTDYQSPGWIGSFSSSIYWTPLVINCTNLMHSVLNWLYIWVPNYGLCVILLTVLVRGLMFPLSLKQAQTMAKMQALAPELKAMQEKYKDDRHAMAQAQMDLYRKHGVNPFGTCWVILLQLPVFMGLWYALQESIFFRLAPFYGTYIVNLAAPDMLWEWGRNIPFISQDSAYGGFFYLGPYLNILPLFAVGLMLVQQKMMTPPPTNEQEEANQRVMTIMMCVMGLLFYKIAAGVCIYFIASSLWGVAERQFLPKPKKAAPGGSSSTTTTTGSTGTSVVRLSPGTAPAASITTTAAPTPTSSPATQSSAPADQRGRPGKKGKKVRRIEVSKPTETRQEPEAEPTTTLGRIASWWRKRRQAMSEWWAKILRDAEKK